MSKIHLNFVITTAILLLLLCLAFIWSMMSGAVIVSVNEIINSLFQLDGDKQDYIVNQSRLPRSLLAIVTGSSLALSGTIIQTLLNNPLASPNVIGINYGASLALLLTTIFIPSFAQQQFVIIAALGGIFVACLVYFLSELYPISSTRIILIGLAIGFIMSTGVDFILATSDTYIISAPMVWMTGSLWSRGWQHLNAITPILIIISFCCLFFSYRLDLIRLGITQAKGLGVNIKLERSILMLLATLLTAISVAVVGVISFIGLMSPHIASKLIVDKKHVYLMPISMIIGALLLLLSDTLGRAISPPIEISAGILTAIIGAPFFIVILLSNSSEINR